MLNAINTQLPSWSRVIPPSVTNWIKDSVQTLSDRFDIHSRSLKEAMQINTPSNQTGNTSGKKIVFCADGTWDTPKENSNVYKIFKAILRAPDQIAFYDDGVGSDGVAIQKLSGGAMGVGLFDKIKDGYTKIAESYKPGDQIFIFGFSRGAYTARSLAGMISDCGLPTAPCNEKVVDEIFKAYRNPLEREAILKNLSSYNFYKAPIKMVGVWDTVGSLGIPAIFGKIGPLFSFLDTKLHPNIANAYHALAIDERRQQFPPTLWAPPSPPVPGQTLEQVWFPGAHSDVGGGYPESGLSDVCLTWMMKKAENLGLQMDPATNAKENNALDTQQALDTLHNSWSLLWLLPNSREIPKDSSISNSVAIRAEQTPSYRPKNLNWKNGALADSYKIEEVLTPATSSV